LGDLHRTEEDVVLNERIVSLQEFGFCVYDHPIDYPNSYVARRWYTGSMVGNTAVIPDRDEFIVASDLETIRNEMRKKGLTQVPRHVDDDPVILEIWI
jgi:hypothetical protein